MQLSSVSSTVLLLASFPGSPFAAQGSLGMRLLDSVFYIERGFGMLKALSHERKMKKSIFPEHSVS